MDKRDWQRSMARRSAAAASLVAFAASLAVAGGPLPGARVSVLGRCPDGSACIDNLDGEDLGCAVEECRIAATGVFTGRVSVSIDETPCPGDGAHVTIAFDGTTGSGDSILAEPAVLNFCGVDISSACEDSAHTTPFYCTRSADSDVRLSAAMLPGPSWLTLHPLPASIAREILHHFPPDAGTPVIMRARSCSAGGTPTLPSTAVSAEYCVKG